MANEFVARNGLIALDNSFITGSLSVSGSLFTRGLTAGSGSGDVVMYNTASGQFFFTASSAIGGGGGGNASNDNFQQIFLLMGG